MALQFVLGNSGSGKSRYLYQQVVEEASRHPERNYMVIVPEQFTMQTQKDLVMLHPNRGIMNIDVLSFRRLAHRIFEEVGADRRSVLTETGKNLMIRKVAIEQKDRLQVLGSRMNRTGYVSEVKSILSELMQYEITEFELQEMLRIAESRPLLKAKLEDIRILYHAFLEYQKDRFMKPEELLDVLCHVAGKSRLLRRSTIVLDGFVGLTPAQLNVMEELLTYCPQVRMAVTFDAREPVHAQIREHELFACSRKLMKAVTERAQRAYARRGAACADEKTKAEDDGMIKAPVILGTKQIPRFTPGRELAHLEQNLFRRERTAYRKNHTGNALEKNAPKRVTECFGKYDEECTEKSFEKRDEDSELSLHVCATPAAEVHFAARTISRLVREQGYRYQEIAVIAGDLSAYDHYVKKIFPLYEVPAFLDETRHILLNPCLEFIRGALQMAEKNYSSESVMRCLRTGMLDLSAQETDRLENYVLAAGIRGRSMWEKEWIYCHGNVTMQELERCNAYRVRVLEQMGSFTEKMQQNGIRLRDCASALLELLEQRNVQQQLKDRELQLMREGAREEAREYSQIYEVLITLLDEMVDLMGEEQVSGAEFSEILDAGFAEARIGIIPPGIDQVQVGDMERSRLAHIKVLFFLGLNDGWVPTRSDGGGIVSDMERELLQRTGIELSPSARENSYIQRFYLYQNLTKPSHHLYLSWCSAGGDGAAMRPSYLVGTIQKLFPDLKIVQEAEIGSSVYQVTSPKNGMLYLTKGLERVRRGEEDPAWMELYRRYLQDEEHADTVRELVKAALAEYKSHPLSAQTAQELYGTVMKSSVTRLEQFAACAFSHFVSYGLNLRERQRYGVKPVDLGNIFHSALELFSRKVQKEAQSEAQDWLDLPQERQDQIMEQCVDEVTAEYGFGVLHSSAREQYTIRRLKRILCRSAWALGEQLRAGSFRPSGFEVSFDAVGALNAVQVPLGDAGQMHLRGRIDRIDTAQQEEAVYVKVVDYKSGMKQFDPVSLYYGLQLQLVVYLNTALEMERKLSRKTGKQVIPAGIFYYRLQDPLLDQEEAGSSKELEEKLLKKLRPDGLLNESDEVLYLMDHQMNGDSLVIPAGRKKDGSLKAASSTATTEQFEQLSRFVSGKMKQLGSEMMAGAAEAQPFADRNGSACDFCVFADVCGFDRKIPQKCRRRVPTVNKADVWEKIEQECEEAQDEAELENAAENKAVKAEKEGDVQWQ